MKEFAIFRDTSGQNDNYHSEDHFTLARQISCDSDFEAHDFYSVAELGFDFRGGKIYN